MIDPNIKYPRLFINAPLQRNAQIALEADHVHYLKNVMRKNIGDYIRLFNGADGEWLAQIETVGKKSCVVLLTDCLREQEAVKNRVVLYFSPIKKQRMHMLIEKAVELGVTEIHPVLMQHSDTTKINIERMRAQVIEAAEQCERLDLPIILEPQKLESLFLKINTPVYVCLERCGGAMDIAQLDYPHDIAFLIGPEGGFDEQERRALLGHKLIEPISLGTRILRAETAAIACLAHAYFSTVGRDVIKK